jgi:hypothetical protein
MMPLMVSTVTRLLPRMITSLMLVASWAIAAAEVRNNKANAARFLVNAPPTGPSNNAKVNADFTRDASVDPTD